MAGAFREVCPSHCFYYITFGKEKYEFLLLFCRLAVKYPGGLLCKVPYSSGNLNSVQSKVAK